MRTCLYLLTYFTKSVKLLKLLFSILGDNLFVIFKTTKNLQWMSHITTVGIE